MLGKLDFLESRGREIWEGKIVNFQTNSTCQIGAEKQVFHAR